MSEDSPFAIRDASRDIFAPAEHETSPADFVQPSWMTAAPADGQTPSERDAMQAAEIEATRTQRDADQAEEASLQATWEARQAEDERQRKAQEDAHHAALRTQDDDFHGWRTRLHFTIEGHGSEGDDITSECGSGGWDILNDDAVCAALNAAIPEIKTVIAPWAEHFPSIGFIQHDGDGDLFFHLVHRAGAAGLSPERLGEFPEVRLQVPALPGRTIVLQAETQPVNATRIFEWMREEGGPYASWGGPGTEGLLPIAGESRDVWLCRVALNEDVIARAVERWSASGRCPAIYRHFGDISERADGDRDVEFIADKRIPRGFLTFLVGDSGIGKSSLVHEWIAAFSGVANGRPTTVLGAEVPGRLVCALISAEDGPARINQRARDHAKIWDRCSYLTSPDPLRDLDHHLAQLRQLPNLDLVVFDPLVSFLDDNEDLAHIARPFCNKLTQFAADMNCAVVLVHHIRKGKQPPRTLAEVFDRMRGSSDFKAAARMVICMLKRRDGIVVIGPCKHNFADRDVWLPKFQGDEYRVDDETSTLVPLNAEVGGPDDLDGPDAAAEVEMRVLATVRRCNSSGVIVLRSGKAGLFESRPQELTGISRAAILAAVDNLVTAGQLIGGGRAGLHLPAPSAADEGSATDE
ncbi:AAA family ATPase [Novosphingobium sp. G106]|uniref:AAA family ATPase n=1 Tax=Novosphingobium sp. G106 TaxID=2849500 RepID=UPI001C2D8827|nr:AAA family ATPase [Novosphingobium sp. G106]MBV1687440.1 AAA family ATPase [Novosphingobium sp. G106]